MKIEEMKNEKKKSKEKRKMKERRNERYKSTTTISEGAWKGMEMK